MKEKSVYNIIFLPVYVLRLAFSKYFDVHRTQVLTNENWPSMIIWLDASNSINEAIIHLLRKKYLLFSPIISVLSSYYLHIPFNMCHIFSLFFFFLLNAPHAKVILSQNLFPLSVRIELHKLYTMIP
jgi:hypothetical protein